MPVASVDGGNEVDVQGYTPNREFDQVLFKTGDLADGTHEIVSHHQASPHTLLPTPHSIPPVAVAAEVTGDHAVKQGHQR
jgi:hypothetical protein